MILTLFLESFRYSYSGPVSFKIHRHHIRRRCISSSGQLLYFMTSQKVVKMAKTRQKYQISSKNMSIFSCQIIMSQFWTESFNNFFVCVFISFTILVFVLENLILNHFLFPPHFQNCCGISNSGQPKVAKHTRFCRKIWLFFLVKSQCHSYRLSHLTFFWISQS